MWATVSLKQDPEGDVLLIAHNFNMNINVCFEKHKKPQISSIMTGIYPYILE